jgi:prevent-host-death family protein
MTETEDGTSTLTPNQKGAIAEAAIEKEAVKLGLVVARPNLDARYDLIFDTGESLLRVQCKWGNLSTRECVVKVNLVSSWCTPTGYARSTYQAGEVDLFAVYCHELDSCYLLEAAGLAGRRAIHLRLSEPRNSQRACVNLASDFAFDGAIAQSEERLRGTQEAAGSSPASSTSSASAEVVGAHEFRNHFGWYMERAAAGETFHVTRRGRPYVRLTGADSTLRQPRLELSDCA